MNKALVQFYQRDYFGVVSFSQIRTCYSLLNKDGRLILIKGTGRRALQTVGLNHFMSIAGNVCSKYCGLHLYGCLQRNCK